MRNFIRHIIRIACVSLIALPVLGQDKVDLQPYKNDTLGFSINLPEEPVWIPKDEKGAGGMFLCQQSNPMVVISIKRSPGERPQNIDDYIKQGFQVGDVPLKIKKTKCNGYKARKVSFTSNRINTLCLLVSRESSIYTFMLLQSIGSEAPLNPEILDSIKFF